MNTAVETPMVVRRTLSSALRLLNTCGVQYKVITPWGEQFGTLPVAAETKDTKRRKAPRKYALGELRSLYGQAVATLKVGEVAQVPFSGYPPNDLRGQMAAYAHGLWNKDSYRTCITETHVELMRIK